MEEYWRVLYRKLISRNGQVKAQNKCKLLQLLCVVVSVTLHGEFERFCGFCVDCTYSNSQRKTHKIAQIRHVKPDKRQHTTIKVGLHLFWALTWPFLDISLRYKTLQYSSIHFFIFPTNNQTRCLCGSPVIWCAPTWRFHTELSKFMRNISPNICGLGERKHLKLGEVSSLFIFNRITISWLHSLNGFRFIFLLRDSENDL